MWFRKRESDIEMSGMVDEAPKKKKPQGPPEETEYQKFDWKRFFLAPKYIPWHILFIVIGILTVIITIKHDAVVEKLRPWSEKVRDLPAGWLIPIAILIIISFPPLFGHEIIALLCGVVYGLWIGFAIVAAGTFIGEVGTWYAFKHAFRSKAIKLERTNLNYGAMARLTRDGGFFIVLIIRLSAIPAHFSTAVFSTCDVKFWHFVVATFLSLPKQIFLVYLGVLLLQESNDDVIKTVMFGAIFVITIAMGVWIYLKMRTVKKTLLEEQELRRVKKAEAVELVPNVERAFDTRYDEEPVAWSTMQPTQVGRPMERRYDEEPPEWAMAPTQPTRMV
ncbi:hypothetical protein G6011_00446 [Alternaria panax]|uniref:Golgi apparatus membrane protein TVP38 n=1 Tax=Alternaria panax TaxID=48097 RepID=A0AAD4NVS7_9PLEO|nr:hypothetical protein G6011_00446 [Alternaria panax]